MQKLYPTKQVKWLGVVFVFWSRVCSPGCKVLKLFGGTECRIFSHGPLSNGTSTGLMNCCATFIDFYIIYIVVLE